MQNRVFNSAHGLPAAGASLWLSCWAAPRTRAVCPDQLPCWLLGSELEQGSPARLPLSRLDRVTLGRQGSLLELGWPLAPSPRGPPPWAASRLRVPGARRVFFIFIFFENIFYKNIFSITQLTVLYCVGYM